MQASVSTAVERSGCSAQPTSAPSWKTSNRPRLRVEMGKSGSVDHPRTSILLTPFPKEAAPCMQGVLLFGVEVESRRDLPPRPREGIGPPAGALPPHRRRRGHCCTWHQARLELADVDGSDYCRRRSGVGIPPLLRVRPRSRLEDQAVCHVSPRCANTTHWFSAFNALWAEALRQVFSAPRASVPGNTAPSHMRNYARHQSCQNREGDTQQKGESRARRASEHFRH